MSATFNSFAFWGMLTVLVVAGAFAIDVVFRTLLNRLAHEQGRYPHRIANELPRILHKVDHKETAN